MRFLIRFVKYFILSLLYLWSIGAVYYLKFLPDGLRTPAMWLFILLIPLLLIFFRKKSMSYFLALLICLSLAAYYKFEPASDKGDVWQTSWAVMPSVTFKGDEVEIKNIRDFHYRSETDFMPHYYDRTYNLNDLESLYIVFSYWDGNKAVAHTILSFGFKGGKYLCVSVETRLKKGQVQSGIEGLYNQYGLIYILADENDVLKLRTNYRKEDVYMYRVKMDKSFLKTIFIAIMNKANDLNLHPQFYNSVKHNCFTSLLYTMETGTGEKIPFDYRYICNGYADEMFYNNGIFVTEGEDSFSEFKKRHYINQYVTPNADKEAYSKEIRKFEKRLK